MKKTDSDMRKIQTSDFFIACVVFLVAFFLRLVYLTQYQASPFYTSPIIDALSHYTYALRGIAGDWLGKGIVAPRVPLYVYFLAVLFKFFGAGYTAARAAQIVMGALNCVLVFFLGRKVFNRPIAAFAGFVCAGYGVLLHFDAEFLSVGLSIFLNLVLLLYLLHAIERPRLWKWGVSGILFGLSLQTSANVILFFPLLCAWVWFFFPEREKKVATIIPAAAEASLTELLPAAAEIPRSRGRAHGAAVRSIVCIMIGVFLTMVPFALRNYFAGGDLVLLSSTIGINLYIGNNPAADGKSAPPPSRDFSYGAWEDNVWVSSIKLAERAAGKKLTSSETSRFWMMKTVRFIFTQPWSFLGLLARKFYFCFNAFEIPENQSIYFFRVWSSLLQVLVFSGKFLSFPFGIICPLALVGAAVTFRKEKGEILLLLFIAAHLAVMVIFFVVSRYRAPLIPYFVLFAGAGMAWLWKLFLSRQLKTLGYSLLLLALIFLFCNSRLFNVTDDSRSRWFFKLGTAFAYKGEQEKALKSFLQAHKLDPHDPDTEYNIGVLYLEKGVYDMAVEHFERVLASDPADSAAYNNIGMVLARQGHAKEAVSYYVRALAIDPDDVRSTVNLGSAYIMNNNFEEAAAVFAKAQKLAPDFAPLYNSLGVLAEKQGNDAQAEQYYRKAVALKTDYFEAYYNLAAFYERLGQQEKMIAARAKASALLLQQEGH